MLKMKLTRLTEAAIGLRVDVVVSLLDADPLDARVRSARAARHRQLAARAGPAVNAGAVEDRTPVHGHGHT